MKKSLYLIAVFGLAPLGSAARRRKTRPRAHRRPQLRRAIRRPRRLTLVRLKVPHMT